MTGEERRGTVELTRGLSDVPGDDEHLAHAHVAEPRQQLAQVRAIEHKAGSQMRHDPVAMRRQPLRERDCGLDSPRGRGGHRERDLGADVRDHVLLDAVERRDLEARTAEEVDEDAGLVGQCSVASRCLGISFLGSMNGIATTTASRRSPSISTSISVPRSASSIGSMA
jgi:hypothetical protein